MIDYEYEHFCSASGQHPIAGCSCLCVDCSTWRRNRVKTTVDYRDGQRVSRPATPEDGIVMAAARVLHAHKGCSCGSCAELRVALIDAGYEPR